MSGNRTVTNDIFINIENGCEDISGLDFSTSKDEIFKIVDAQPCVSAVSLGRFQIHLRLNHMVHMQDIICI